MEHTPSKQYITWVGIEMLVDKLADEIFLKLPNIDSVMGLPRGGLIPAVLLSHKTGLPFVLHPGKNTLVVDDINDTGETLNKAPGVYHAVLHHKPTSIFTPDLYSQLAGESWIVYPWENKNSEPIQDYLK